MGAAGCMHRAVPRAAEWGQPFIAALDVHAAFDAMLSEHVATQLRL